MLTFYISVTCTSFVPFLLFSFVLLLIPCTQHCIFIASLMKYLAIQVQLKSELKYFCFLGIFFLLLKNQHNFHKVSRSHYVSFCVDRVS